MTQTPLNNKTDLSYINSLKDLRKEIVKVKGEVKIREKEMIEQFKKMPKEIPVVAARAVIPLIAKRGVPTRVFNLITNGIGLFISIRKQRKGMNAVISKVKQLILYNLLGKAIKLYQQKRNQGKLSAERK
ncbi:MAG TPA: hypothetical protein VH396_04910 [Chitinophagaceae bacterium]|jgi:hypothetical protein